MSAVDKVAPVRGQAQPGLGCRSAEAACNPNPKPCHRKQFATSTFAATTHETSDAWGKVVAHPAPGWRVIVCRDDLQWIIQRRKNGGAERPWRALHYCRTRKALLRLCASLCGQIDPNASATLEALPEVIGRAGK